ncbi:MAG TPA: sulfite exporter TauE/SafE family protein [Pyrinomonadaceae bacterium]|nr:sulfite exporter TauE/SafE family protein [Chloracidobacterium sp.]MBP9935112.1 sulfite exporter TauE/SafE family protein [Pyrinomonadaceae bacterium]MBK9438711.1 sulfite exporter TauE/SafE family protein [Chloracidobacterium sp.]MBK9766768.1 sulfite exporter TauE/SafE family protein [Chloracidobacterium sp.]HQX54900.1 sulfite exporter TauE/SafE family protein [Pyrinomonadaceae bacterium]
MPNVDLILLVIIYLLTSAVGVVTGSNSLIAVPVMFQFGVPARIAVATNMFALVFMSVGGTIPFLRNRTIDVRRISPLLLITLASSALGAILVGYITDQGLKLIVSVAMIAVSIFILVKRDSGVDPQSSVTGKSLAVTFVLTFILGVYGGLFSGGYVTMLTAVLVAFFGMTFSQSIAATKLINVVSSTIATAVFMWQGLVDYKLGLILGVTMFVGAYVGAYYTTKMSDVWLKRIFLFTVLLLAIKILYDYF